MFWTFKKTEILTPTSGSYWQNPKYPAVGRLDFIVLELAHFNLRESEGLSGIMRIYNPSDSY